MDSREAAQYAPQIISALQGELLWLENEGPEAAERGLMVYFDGPDSVEQKVQSYFFKAEVREGQLWGVAECKVRGELTPLELQHLTDDIPTEYPIRNWPDCESSLLHRNGAGLRKQSGPTF